MAMHRTQLFLDEGQHRRLSRLAATRNRSISEIVRDYVERGLQEDEKDREERRAALRRMGESRRKLERLYGVYQGDLIAEVREERERDRNRVLTDASDAGRR